MKNLSHFDEKSVILMKNLSHFDEKSQSFWPYQVGRYVTE